MYWLQPPPRMRRAAAVLLIVAAIAWDLHAETTEPYPVVAVPIAAGDPVTAESIAWIDIPASLLPVPDLSAVSAARDLAAGEPLTAALLQGPISAPAGWWTVPVAVGTTARPGDEALLVVADPPFSVIGLVIEPQVGDRYDLDHRPASVAVPADAAALVAAAEQAGLLVTAVRATPGRE